MAKRGVDTPEVRLSKALAWALRHGAQELGLDMRPSGYVELDQLLKVPKFKHVSMEDIEKVVRNCAKKRYTITTDASGDVKYIRANQGHTLQIVRDEDLLSPIEDPNELEKCIHGTYSKCWNSILELGLCRMTRNHIHMTSTEVVGGDVVSGIRGNCDVHLYINHRLAMADGISFYRSSNNVILSPGVGERGVIERKYFLKAVDKQGRVLYPPLDQQTQ